MSDIELALPVPVLNGMHQPGIVDPLWPSVAPSLKVDDALYERYYAGQVERQQHLHLVTADVRAICRPQVIEVMKELTNFVRRQMARTPPPPDRPYDPVVATQRVSITVGFGATLFANRHGDDRFGLAAGRPTSLKIMPRFEGDEAFDPRNLASDLIVLIQSDDVYVNEYLVSLILYGKVHPLIELRGVERGYARPDSREPSGFEDGISNPKALPPDDLMRSLVFVGDGDGEPQWCRNGTYLAYRKIRRRMAAFFDLNDKERELVFGVQARTGDRIASPKASSHAHKMNPRRKTRDLFGRFDESRRFLRRPFFYSDGLDKDGQENRGVLHLSFARDLVGQYEWPVLMWQTNPDFPTKGAGMDALYRQSGGASNVAGGYYFLPGAPSNVEDYFGSALFEQ